MMSLKKSLRLATFRGIRYVLKVRALLIAAMVIGLGVLLGYLFHTPEMAEITISVLVICLMLGITVSAPLNGVLVLLATTAFFETWINIPMGAGVPDLSFERFTVAFLAIVMLAQAAVGRYRP